MGKKPEYKKAAEELGRLLLERNIRLVYGGANVGLMQILADTVLKGGGEVIGIMPQMLIEKEVAHANLTKMITVGSMSERKSRMVELSDAFIAMPGGFGTLDELAEVITYNQLRLTDKPIGILNTAGYFDPLVAFFDHITEEGFLRYEHRQNHTGDEKAAVGIAQVVSAPYADPKEQDDRLVVVDVKPRKKLGRPVTLSDFKADPAFAGWDLLRISRLSVVPVPDAMWERILELAKEE